MVWQLAFGAARYDLFNLRFEQPKQYCAIVLEFGKRSLKYTEVSLSLVGICCYVILRFHFCSRVSPSSVSFVVTGVVLHSIFERSTSHTGNDFKRFPPLMRIVKLWQTREKKQLSHSISGENLYIDLSPVRQSVHRCTQKNWPYCLRELEAWGANNFELSSGWNPVVGSKRLALKPVAVGTFIVLILILQFGVITIRANAFFSVREKNSRELLIERVFSVHHPQRVVFAINAMQFAILFSVRFLREAACRFFLMDQLSCRP